MARVLGVIARSADSGSRLKVRGSISAKTGSPPAWWMALQVAMQVDEGTTTSEPGPTPLRCRARCREVVQALVATPYFAPTYDATAFSNSATFGPWLIQPERITSAAAR